MNKYHQQILKEIKNGAVNNKRSTWVSKYLGTPHVLYSLSSSKKRTIARSFLKEHPKLSLVDFKELLKALFTGKSFEEKTIASLLLEYQPKLRKELDPKLLDSWLDNLVGWAEIDSLCQSNFTAKELLQNWVVWEKLLRKFSQDKNINKRRASLVLLKKAVGQSDDQKLSDLAFANLEKLKGEKDVLITKAISWLLRGLTINHKDLVKSYLEENKNSLPKIAVRETTKKLKTGKK